MTMKLEFETDNASFKADRSATICQVLREVAETILQGSEEGVIHDIDGNRIGQYAMTEEAAEDAAPVPPGSRHAGEDRDEISD